MRRTTTPLRAALLACLFQLAPLASAVAVAPPADLSGLVCSGVCATSGADGDIGLSPLANPRYGLVATSGSAVLGVSPLALPSNSRGNGAETNGSRIVSGAFHAEAGDELDLRFNDISTDGKSFDGYAWVRLLNAADNTQVAWLFTARSFNSSTRNIVPGGVVDKKEFDPDAVIVDYASYDFHSKRTPDNVKWSWLGSSDGVCWKDNAPGCGFTDWLHSQLSFASAGEYRVEIVVVNRGDASYGSGLAFDFGGLTSAGPESPSLLLALLGLGIFATSARARAGD